MLTFCGIRLHFHQGVFTSPVEFLRRKGVKNTGTGRRTGARTLFFDWMYRAKNRGRVYLPLYGHGDCVFISPGERELTGEGTRHEEADTTATATERLRIVVAHQQRPAALSLGSESGAANGRSKRALDLDLPGSVSIGCYRRRRHATRGSVELGRLHLDGRSGMQATSRPLAGGEP